MIVSPFYEISRIAQVADRHQVIAWHASLETVLLLTSVLTSVVA